MAPLGRKRIKIDEKRGDAAYFATLEKELAGCQGVVAVETNPLTGAALISHTRRIQVFGIMLSSTSCSTSERMKPQREPHRALQSLVEPRPPNISHTRNPEGDQISGS